MQPPSLGARVLARFLDGLVIAVVVAIVAGIFDVQDSGRIVLTAVFGIAYETTAVSMWRRTVGKAVCKLAVTTIDGDTVSPPRAAVRAVVLLLPIYLLAPRIDTVVEWAVLLVVLANVVVVAMRRDDRRGLHDLVAGTRPIAA